LQTNILKYLPGGIWHFAERFRVIKSEFSLKNSFLSVALEPFLMVIAASFFIPFGNYNIFVKYLSFLPLLVFIPKFRNAFFNSFLSYIYEKFNKNNILSLSLEDTSEDKLLNTKFPLKVLFLEMLFISFRFLGFWFCLKAFNITNSLFFLDWLSVFSLAWVLGLVVPAAPGGVGVFEAIMLLLIGSLVSEAPLISSLVCYRLVSTFSDIIAYLQFSLTRKIQ
tara:strand:+ start:1536 stop:2201 length:666 start_codon:yes stop_codon:yes gene_type:complete